MRTMKQADVIGAEDAKLLQEIKRVIQEFLPTATVLLYGSVARGAQDSESDYDILVLTDEALTFSQEDQIDDAIYDLQLEAGTVISTMFYARSQWELPLFRGMPFRHEVEKDAVLL